MSIIGWSIRRNRRCRASTVDYHQWQRGPARAPAPAAVDSDATGPGQLINMLTVEGREQVLLKVSVVEMERNIVKQFGVDLNALISSGNFAFAALSDLPFPINVAGKGFWLRF